MKTEIQLVQHLRRFHRAKPKTMKMTFPIVWWIILVLSNSSSKRIRINRPNRCRPADRDENREQRRKFAVRRTRTIRIRNRLDGPTMNCITSNRSFLWLCLNNWPIHRSWEIKWRYANRWLQNVKSRRNRRDVPSKRKQVWPSPFDRLNVSLICL